MRPDTKKRLGVQFAFSSLQTVDTEKSKSKKESDMLLQTIKVVSNTVDSYFNFENFILEKNIALDEPINDLSDTITEREEILGETSIFFLTERQN